MFRKRLLSLLAAILVGVASSPAAAATGVTAADTAPADATTAATSAEAQAPAPMTAVDVAKANGRLAALAQEARAADPEVDQEVPGVGRVMVDVDEDEGSITVALRVDPAGVDETVTVGGDGSEEEPPAEEPGEATAGDHGAPTPAEEQAAADKQAMEQAKRDAATVAVAAGPTAFTSEAEARGASGEASAGTGVARSVRPSSATPDDAPTAATDFADDGQNPWLRLFGSLLLAGTGTAWSMAKKHGLA